MNPLLRAALLLALTLSGCQGKDRSAPAPQGGGESKVRGEIVAGPRPAVRNTVSTGRGPAQAMVRLHLARITEGDGLRLMLRFEANAHGDAGPPPQYDWSKLAMSLRFTIRPPSGAARVLEIAAAPERQVSFAKDGVGLVIDKSGLVHWAKALPWKVPATGLFAEPGKYTARIEGTLPLDRGDTPFAVDTPPFEVVAESASFLSTADLAARAATAVKGEVTAAIVSKLSDVAQLAIDDIEDARWLRFNVAHTGVYQAHVVDVRMSPAGKVLAMRDFTHFTCVAEGTMIATPTGERAIQTLSPGEEVWAYDPGEGRKVVTRVLAARRGLSTSFVRVGGALLTPEHPVEVMGGSFVAAGSLSAGAEGHDLEGHVRPLPAATPVAQIAPVIDLSVGWPHTFFAGGVLVHNKAVAVPLAPGDPWDPWHGTFVRETDQRSKK